MKPTEQEIAIAGDAAFNKAKADGHVANLMESLAFKVAWEAGAQWAISLQPEWVSVTDRLPERHVDVLVFFIGAWKNKPVYKVDNYTIDGFWQNTSNNIITHWMPLPDAPQPPTK